METAHDLFPRSPKNLQSKIYIRPIQIIQIILTVQAPKVLPTYAELLLVLTTVLPSQSSDASFMLDPKQKINEENSHTENALNRCSFHEGGLCLFWFVFWGGCFLFCFPNARSEIANKNPQEMTKVMLRMYGGGGEKQTSLIALNTNRRIFLHETYLYEITMGH